MIPLHFALLGGNPGYSLSPDIFRAIFRKLGREGRFDLCPAQPEHLEEAVKSLATGGVTGFSVTIPHKQTMIEHLDSADRLVHAVGAVNSVAVRDGSLLGYNTDCYGVSFALKQAGFEGCEQALILGAGGAARAVVHTLAVDFGVRDFVLCGRKAETLSRLECFFSVRLYEITIQSLIASTYIEQSKPGSRIVVNCTPLGGPLFPHISPVPSGLEWSKVGLYFDLNYNSDNIGVKLAKDAGMKAIDGSSMLVAQALKSMELWTGIRVNHEDVYRQIFPGPAAPQSREV
jgi:shikimate dehydrogenase